MRISIKHFVIGAAFGLIPISIYAADTLSIGGQVLGARTSVRAENETDYAQIDLNSNLKIENIDLDSGEFAIDFTQAEPISTPSLTPIPTPIATPNPTKAAIATLAPTAVPAPPSKLSIEMAAFDYPHNQDVQTLIKKYAAQYGVDENMMLIIAKCESGFRPEAVNGPFAGIYQFLSTTWVSNRNAMGLDSNPALRFNAEEAARTAAFKMSRDGFGAWPACSQKAYSQLGI